MPERLSPLKAGQCHVPASCPHPSLKAKAVLLPAFAFSDGSFQLAPVLSGHDAAVKSEALTFLSIAAGFPASLIRVR